MAISIQPNNRPERVGGASSQPARQMANQAHPVKNSMGRKYPTKTEKKEKLSIWLDKDILVWLRSTGKGWQARINDILRDEMADKS